MIPVYGLPYSCSLFHARHSVVDVFEKCVSADEFFRRVAEKEFPSHAIKSLDSMLFGYLAFDYSENYSFFRTLEEEIHKVNNAMGTDFILWSMISPNQEEVATTANTEKYRLWYEEIEAFTPIFTSSCLKELGVPYNGNPILILAESLTSNKVIVAEFEQKHPEINRILFLFNKLSDCTRYFSGSSSERKYDLLLTIEECGYHCKEQTISGNRSFAKAMESVYKRFLEDPTFSSELNQFY